MAKKSKAQAAARRRQAKQRRDKRRSGRPSGGTDRSSESDRYDPSGFDPFAAVTEAERVALEWEGILVAMRSGDTASAEVLTRRVAAGPSGRESRLYLETLAEAMTRAVAGLWPRGWRPAEVIRQVRRAHRRNAHESLAAAAILGEARTYNRAGARFDDATWNEQLDDALAQWSWADTMVPALTSDDTTAWFDAWLAGQGADRAAALRGALEVIVTLRSLPPIEVLGPFPGSTGVAGGPVPGAAVGLPTKLLERVRALLAKAESTDYPDEAAAFTAKAQEIMSRHAIDAALLGSRAHDREKPTQRRVDIDDPYPQSKATLLQVVCEANRARAAWSKALGFSSVVGFPADLDIVEILFGSLLVQSTAAMLAHGSRRSAHGHNNTTAFRRAFMDSYANRIGERLQESTQAAVDAAAAESGTDLLPVLASREDEVDQAMQEAFPDIVHRRSSRSYDRQGFLAGAVAADLADLTLFDELAG